MEKSFYGGDGCEVCRIVEKNNGRQYLICDDNDVAMREVGYDEFCKFLDKFENVTAHSWNKKWREKYLEMRRFLYE